MKQPPEYYERIIDGIRRGSGIELDAEFIAKAEEVCGKPFRELTADDLEQASAVTTAETMVYVASEEEAIAWAMTISAAMQKRGAANVRELREMLLVADDPDAAVELDALRSFARFHRPDDDDLDNQ